jgi:hypothetical protein
MWCRPLICFAIVHYRIIAEVDCSIWSVALMTLAFIS